MFFLLSETHLNTAEQEKEIGEEDKKMSRRTLFCLLWRFCNATDGRRRDLLPPQHNLPRPTKCVRRFHLLKVSIVQR